MDVNFIFQAFDNIDDAFIEEAEAFHVTKAARKPWVRYAVIAAAAILTVTGIALLAGKYFSQSKKEELDGDITMPCTQTQVPETVPELQTSTSEHSDTDVSEDTAACGGTGVFATEGVCVKLEGTDYWLTDEEGYALLMKDYDSIQSSLISSGVPAANMRISEKGYGHMRSDDCTVSVNFRDYLVYNDEKLVSIISVWKDEEGTWYSIAFGGTWFADYNAFLKKHVGEKLVYVYYGYSEAILTPDGKVYQLMNFTEIEGLNESFDYYGFYDQGTNTYTPS